MKLFRKQFILLSIVTIICFGVLMLITSTSVARTMADEKKAVLQETGQTVSQMASYRLDSADFSYSMSSIASVVGSAINAKIFITDISGTITVCNCSDFLKYGNCQHVGTAVPREILDKMASGNYFEIGTLGSLYKAKYYTSTLRIEGQNAQTTGYVIVSSPASELSDFSMRMYRIFLLSMIFPVAVLLLAFYYANYRVTRPLKLMSSAAKAIAQGDFSRRIPVETDDEIGELAESFNHMTNSLVQLESMRRSFVANVSHELKTPMTTIGGFIDGILDGTIPAEKQTYYLTVVSEEIRRLSRLVVGMLSLSKLESGEMKINRTRFNFTDVICSSVLSLEQKIEEKHIDIRGLDTMEALPISGDRDLLHQVVYNLSDNAVKFTQEGGYISFTARQEGTNIKLAIRNSGEGIEPKDLPHVFERFYKTDRSRSKDKNGTGLGLYIVKTIVDIHGGSITVSSVVGEYTEFIIVLPADAAEPVLPEKAK